MIRRIRTYDECRDFVSGFRGDPDFSDPMLLRSEQVQCNLIRPIERPQAHLVLGVYREDRLTGLFAFLRLPDEKYMELLAGLSRERDAYQELFGYLERHCPGYQADFVFNPRNYLLKELLAQRQAEFDPEQQKMVLTAPPAGIDTCGIEPLSGRYAAQYCAIHSKDVYWTGEKVLQAQDRFRTFLAIRDGAVAGYIDVTCTLPENEPYDLLVLPEYRRMGYGRKLLASAVGANAPNGMMLYVDADNAPVIGLYTSMGFAAVPGQNNLTAHWTLPDAKP